MTVSGSPFTERLPKARRASSSWRLGGPPALGLGAAVVWLSLLVLIPLAAVVVTSTEGGWFTFEAALANSQTLHAVVFTVVEALLVTALDLVMGTTVAWVLVRDRFPGQRILDVLIDIPFALPTIVAGLVLLALYGPHSPIGVDLAQTRTAVFLALAFVTLPFVVRSVQPVLQELDQEVEEAAASLGASPASRLRRIILPALVPAIAAGGALSFARAMSEYGSMVLLSGNLPNRTEVASVRVFTYIESGDATSAAVVATMLLSVSFVTLLAIELIQRKVARRG